jgi:hypothetical protein
MRLTADGKFHLNLDLTHLGAERIAGKLAEEATLRPQQKLDVPDCLSGHRTYQAITGSLCFRLVIKHLIPRSGYQFLDGRPAAAKTKAC